MRLTAPNRNNRPPSQEITTAAPGPATVRPCPGSALVHPTASAVPSRVGRRQGRRPFFPLRLALAHCRAPMNGNQTRQRLLSHGSVRGLCLQDLSRFFCNRRGETPVPLLARSSS